VAWTGAPRALAALTFRIAPSSPSTGVALDQRVILPAHRFQTGFTPVNLQDPGEVRRHIHITLTVFASWQEGVGKRRYNGASGPSARID
jgi:hypothetical protein